MGSLCIFSASKTVAAPCDGSLRASSASLRRSSICCALKQQIRVHPAFDAFDRAHPHQAAADFDDIQPVAMLNFGNAWRFRRQILPQIHADGTHVSDADRRQLRSAGVSLRRMASGDKQSTADREQQRGAARAEKSGNDHRRSER